MSGQDSPKLNLISLTPIGFRKIRYSVDSCSLCRGSLNDLCIDCQNNNRDYCPVIEQEGEFPYHRHCHFKLNH